VAVVGRMWTTRSSLGVVNHRTTSRLLKPAFHDADTDILARMSVSWNAGFILALGGDCERAVRNLSKSRVCGIVSVKKIPLLMEITAFP